MGKSSGSPPDFRKMYQLAEHYSRASSILNEEMEKEGWGASAPRLLVDSFAVELYLKCLYVLDESSKPPHGHNWESLFRELASHTQTAIRDQFNRIVDGDPVLRNIDTINPEARRFTDFDRSLSAGSTTFDKRRYLYEGQQSSDEWFYANLLRRAIRSATRMDVRLARLVGASGDD